MLFSPRESQKNCMVAVQCGCSCYSPCSEAAHNLCRHWKIGTCELCQVEQNTFPDFPSPTPDFACMIQEKSFLTLFTEALWIASAPRQCFYFSPQKAMLLVRLRHGKLLKWAAEIRIGKEWRMHTRCSSLLAVFLQITTEPQWV